MLIKDRPRQLNDCRELLQDYTAKAERAFSASPTAHHDLDYASLLQIDWIDSVWQMHDQLRQSAANEAEGLAIAAGYLRLQYKLNTDPRPLIDISEPAHKLDVKALEKYLAALLHPYQVPLNLNDIQVELKTRYRFDICYQLLLRHCVRLSQNGDAHPLLQRFPNPYKQRQHVYCNAEFQVKPQIGDKVMELVHMRSRRLGTVVEFKLYRPHGKYYPVIQTETHQCFVDPGRIIVVERLDFAANKPSRSARPRRHLSQYSIH